MTREEAFKAYSLAIRNATDKQEVNIIKKRLDYCKVLQPEDIEKLKMIQIDRVRKFI